MRSQDYPFELGEVGHTSNAWHDNHDSGEGIGGLCATDARSKRIDMHSCEDNPAYGCYDGEHVAVIGGHEYGCGDDPSEVIISDPVVLEILC